MPPSVPKRERSPNTDSPIKERVFFALVPPKEVRHQLEGNQQGWLNALGEPLRGKATPAAKLHLTLSFIGLQSEAQIQRLQTKAKTIQAAPFELTIDRWGQFKRARIGWLGCQPTAPLLNLAQALGADPNRFVPHITLFRGFRQSLPQYTPTPVAWPVESFCLMVSKQGAYRPLASWPLVRIDDGHNEMG